MWRSILSYIRKLLDREPINAICFVVCPHCGGKHRLLPGLEAPIYWCGDELKILQVGDGVEYEEVSKC